MDILDTDCLKLNKNWVPLTICTVRKAIEDAAAEAATLLRFHDGYPIPLRLQEWLQLEVNDKEEYIGISGKFHGQIRKIPVPRVIICVNFDKFIAKEQRPNLKNLARHYNETCAVSGKKLKPEEYSREHVRPRSKGGKDGWTNEVLMDRNLNSLRSNKSYRKVGLKKPKILPAPKALLPINRIINRNGYEEWDLFKIPRP